MLAGLAVEWWPNELILDQLTGHSEVLSEPFVPVVQPGTSLAQLWDLGWVRKLACWLLLRCSYHDDEEGEEGGMSLKVAEAHDRTLWALGALASAALIQEASASFGEGYSAGGINGASYVQSQIRGVAVVIE